MDYVRDFLRLIGRAGIIVSAPGSAFTATYATSETLTLGGVGLPTITDATQILGVVEWPATRARPKVLWKTDHITTYAAPTLTMDGAAFVNGSIFQVMIASQAPASSGSLLSMIGTPGIYHSPDYFAAVLQPASTTTLNLTGLPTVPTSLVFLGVVERTVAGALRTFHPSLGNTFTFTATGPGAGTLLIGGAPALTATSTFLVFYLGLEHALDAVLNTKQTVVMNAIQHDWVDVAPMITAGNFAVTNPQDTGFFVTKGLKWIGVEIAWTALGADTITITPRTDNTDTGVVEHIWTRGDYLYPNGAIGGAVPLDAAGLTLAQAGAGTIYRYLRLAVHSTNRMKLQIASGIATGTVTVRITEQG